MAKAKPEEQGDPHAALASAAQSAAAVHAKASDAVAAAKARIAAIDAALEQDAQRVQVLARKEAQHDGVLAKQQEKVKQLAKALRAAQLAADFADGSDAAVTERAQAALTAAREAHDAAAAQLTEWTQNAQSHVDDDNAERQEIAGRKAQLTAERANLADELAHLEAAAQHTHEASLNAELEHTQTRWAALVEQKKDAERLTLALSGEIDGLSLTAANLRNKLGSKAPSRPAAPSSLEGDTDAAIVELATAWAAYVDVLRSHLGRRDLLRYHGRLTAALAPGSYSPSRLVELLSYPADATISGGVTPDEVTAKWRAAAFALAQLPGEEHARRAAISAAISARDPAYARFLAESRPAGVEGGE